MSGQYAQTVGIDQGGSVTDFKIGQVWYVWPEDEVTPEDIHALYDQLIQTGGLEYMFRCAAILKNEEHGDQGGVIDSNH